MVRTDAMASTQDGSFETVRVQEMGQGKAKRKQWYASPVASLWLVLSFPLTHSTYLPPLTSALCLLEPVLRREYEEAIDAVPQLVAAETRFVDFLRTEDWDAMAAARRLCLYWKYRKEVFGNDRWLRPMAMNGALSDTDMAHFRTGYTVIVDSPLSGPVVLVDLSRTAEFTHGTNARLVFYLVTVLTNERYQTVGVNILQLVTSKPRPPPNSNPEGWHMFRTGLPCRLNQVLVVQAYEPWKEALLESISFQVATLAGFKTKRHPNLLAADSMGGLSLKLQQRGFDRSVVPHAFGGSYDYQQFEEWMRMRSGIEAIFMTPLTDYNLAIESSIPVVAQGALVVKSLAKDNNKNKKQGAVARRAAFRQPGVASAKRPKAVSTLTPKVIMEQPPPKPKKQRPTTTLQNPAASHVATSLGIMTLPEQVKELESRNRALRHDNQRLEGLLKGARQIIAAENVTRETSSYS